MRNATMRDVFLVSIGLKIAIGHMANTTQDDNVLKKN